MKRIFVVLLHAGYWALYVVLLTVVLLMLRAPHGAGFLRLWPVLLLALLPNVAAFYAGYRPVFAHLAERRIGGVVVGVLVACVVSVAAGLLLAYALFGATQPAFTEVGEFLALAVSLFTLAAIHISVALVIRGF